MTSVNDLTIGSIWKKLTRFALPYLFAAFMQTFYGMADLYVVKLFNKTPTTNAVSIGSQFMHMLTVVILGFAMGTTVHIGRAVGAKDRDGASRVIGNSVSFFAIMALFLTFVLLISSKGIAYVMRTPSESVSETITYLRICFAGVPFIVAYNVISSIFRGTGDSKRPMYFVAVACIVNIAMDFLFIGYFNLGAAGAALGTIIGQSVSVLVSLIAIRKNNFGFKLERQNLKLEKLVIGKILLVGGPIALQDGLIQVAFLTITIIANSRGLIDSTAVGIVEKLIGFMFLVPSSFLSAISAFTAQNIGAGKRDRARKGLYYGLVITAVWGLFCAIYNQFFPETLVGILTNDVAVLIAGCAYMKSYAFDTFFASMHFCFSGYFCGDQKSIVSFIHNIISIILIRIPGSYFLSKLYPDSLFPMGIAAPAGSLLSTLICVGFYVYFRKKEKKEVRV